MIYKQINKYEMIEAFRIILPKKQLKSYSIIMMG